MRYRLRTLLILLAVGPVVVAWLSFPSVRGRRSSTWIASERVSLLSDAVRVYEIDTGEMPSVLADLTRPPAQLKNPAKWAGPYLEQQAPPLDPWGQPLGYEVVDRAAGKYRVWSNGPDAKPRTTDDVILGLQEPAPMFRFTIRDVLWPTVVVGPALGLYLQWERARQWRSRAEYMRQNFREHLGVETVWTGDAAGVDFVDGNPDSRLARHRARR